MQDTPTCHQLLGGVIRFLQDSALPALQGRAAYDARLAISLLGTVQRSLSLASAAEREERTRLRALLDRPDDDLEALNRLLQARIESGALAWDDARLLAHLWATTLDKLAVDQPGYSTYVRVRGANSSDTTISPGRGQT